MTKLREPDIIYFGGTFDPPHQGHVDCVEKVMARFPCADIWVAPGLQPAGQGGKHKNPSASFDQRAYMCELAFEAQLSERVRISRIENQMPVPNYTLQVLNEIQKRHPQKNIALLIGQDQIKGFDRWKQPKDILSNFSLIVARRRQDILDESLWAECQALFGRMHLSVAWNREKDFAMFAHLEQCIYLIDEELSQAESRMLRSNIEESNIEESNILHSSWLTETVKNYIIKNQLYI